MATDQQTLSQIQRIMIETVDSGATWSSGLWTVAEVIGYLNDVQRTFIRNTGVVQKYSSAITAAANTKTFTLPADWIFTTRCVWKQDATTRYIEIPRADSMQADLAIPTWRGTSGSAPQGYTDGDLATLKIQLMPPTTSAGVIELVYCYLATALSNSGVELTVPDEFVPGIMYGTMAEMFRKVGRATDLERMEYCLLRYREAEVAAQLMLGGFE